MQEPESLGRIGGGREAGYAAGLVSKAHRRQVRRIEISLTSRSPANRQIPRTVLRFKLGSIKGSKKSGFSPYATPPKRLRIFEFLVRDQEVGGSNPLALRPLL